MNNKNKVMIIGIAILTMVVGMIIVIKKFMPKVSLKKYTKDCLYIAVMDDEIATNNFEGKKVGDGRMIVFPERREFLMYRYRMHLNLYKKYTEEDPPSISFTENGVPLCPGMQKMVYNGFCKGRSRFKWRCPATCGTIEKCPLEQPCSPSK